MVSVVILWMPVNAAGIAAGINSGLHPGLDGQARYAPELGEVVRDERHVAASAWPAIPKLLGPIGRPMERR